MAVTRSVAVFPIFRIIGFRATVNEQGSSFQNTTQSFKFNPMPLKIARKNKVLKFSKIQSVYTGSIV